MVVNFRAHEISRGARELTRTSTLIKKNMDSRPVRLVEVRAN